MRLSTGEIPNICLARLAQQKATKLILQVTKRGSAQAEKSNLKRLNGLEIFAEADCEAATHIGEIVGLFLSYFLVLTTKFYWRSFEFIAAFVWLHFFYHTSQFAS